MFVEDDSEVQSKLMQSLGDYRAKPGQVFLSTVTAWDGNCRQHFPERHDRAVIEQLIAKRDDRIEELEAQLGERSSKP